MEKRKRWLVACHMHGKQCDLVAVELSIEIWKGEGWNKVGAEWVRDEKRMSEEGPPKLYTNKPGKGSFFPSLFLLPEKNCGKSNQISCFDAKFASFVTAQLKQFRGQQKSNGFSSPAAMDTHAAAPPPPPKEPFIRRYKFVWPVLLAVNLGVGGDFFIFTPMTKNRLFVCLDWIFPSPNMNE